MSVISYMESNIKLIDVDLMKHIIIHNRIHYYLESSKKCYKLLLQKHPDIYPVDPLYLKQAEKQCDSRAFDIV